MRKTFFTHFFIWCIILGLNATSVAQNSASNSGKITKSVDNAGVNYTWSDFPAGGTIAYGWAQLAGEFVSMPIPAGTPFSVIAPMVAPGFLSSACFGPDGILYMTDVITDELYIVDLNFGQLFLVGSTGINDPNNGALNGITYNWSSDTFYGVTGTDLYTVDVSTGLAALVGPLGSIGGIMIDIAADCVGQLWGYDVGDDMFYSINPITGAATAVGSIGFDANFGQGMSFDYASGILYLSAFDGVGFTGQLRSVDLATGATTVVFDWGLEQIAPFAIYNGCAPFDLCLVEPSLNPNPANGATDVDINIGSINWTNGAGATSIEVWFDGALVYSGTPVTTYSLGLLNYSTTYSWRVDGSDGNCTTYGQSWDFTTAADPNIVCVFMDDFNGTTHWSAVALNDPCDWGFSTTSDIPGSVWGTPIFPPTADNFYAFASSDACGTAQTVNAYFIGNFSIDASLYQNVWIEFDSDFEVFPDPPVPADTGAVDVSIDGGATWTRVFLRQADTPGEHAVVDLSSLAGLQGDIRFRLCYYGDFSWHWALDNFAVYLDGFVPVELTSFTANVNKRNVILNWNTATETNNHGFEVQRSINGNEFIVTAFVEGKGTTTEINNYSYTDTDLEVGTYSYRLKQVDYDGSFEYSEVIEVEILAPDVFTLEQNYPNPFNPSTKIKFSLAADSKVTLTVFDILGQEVVSLISGNLPAGSHEINFNASNINSGVYFYRIDATGVDGTNFTSVKKMILTK